MKIVKFEGATMRDAIAKVKAELGDQAVIVATRPIRRGLIGSGYEISAAIDQDDDGPSFGGPIAATPPPAAPAPPPPDVDKLLAPLRSEIRSLRALVRSNEPKQDVRAELAALRKLVEQQMRGTPAEAAPSPAASLTAPSHGSAIMLVGPTGAGKTTTIAKLAARAALVDNRNVQIVTFDDYRVGGIDQIRTFAELIGVPLVVAPEKLRELLTDPHTLTLIDTAGRSPRDAGAVEELGARVGTARLEVHLVAPASTSALALDALVARYKPLSPARLLFTKLDEIDEAPELARAPARHGLPITWLATGQAVPEDLEDATDDRVLELAARGLTRAAS